MTTFGLLMTISAKIASTNQLITIFRPANGSARSQTQKTQQLQVSEPKYLNFASVGWLSCKEASINWK